MTWDELFPRLKSRGPIEAGCLALSRPPRSRFPRLKSRGPIEATSCRASESPNGDFPRLKSRGPIEASDSARWSRSRTALSAAEEPRPH